VTLEIRSRLQMADMIARMEAAGAGWHVPLIRAAMAGDLRAVFLGPGTRAPRDMLDTTPPRRPLAVILGGDGSVPAAPAAFPQAARLLRWSRFVALHAAGGEAWHYSLIAEATVRFRRCLVVETTSAGLPDWLALRMRLAPRTAGIGWAVPPEEGSHPLTTAPAGTVLQ
jgi:hypothetical protein